MEMPEFAKEFDGERVRVFLYTGAVIVGRATFKGDWIEVREGKEKVATCNLKYVISISRI